MPRKKISVKKSPKLTLAEQMGNEFKSAPAKINLQFRKDIAVLKVQANKLKLSLNRTQDLSKSAKKKYDTLAAKIQKRSTSALRKQLNAAKNTLLQLTKTTKALSAQLKLSQKHIQTLTERQTHFALLAKQINQLGKLKKLKKPTTQKKQPRKKTLTQQVTHETVETVSPETTVSATETVLELEPTN